MVSAKIRWQAVALGCFVGIAGSIGMGLGFSIMPVVLIVGVFLQPKFPKLGLGADLRWQPFAQLFCI
jgi:hypothetical protein